MLLHKLQQVENFMMQHLKIKNYSNRKNAAKQNAKKRVRQKRKKHKIEQMLNHWIDQATFALRVCITVQITFPFSLFFSVKHIFLFNIEMNGFRS